MLFRHGQTDNRQPTTAFAHRSLSVGGRTDTKTNNP